MLIFKAAAPFAFDQGKAEGEIDGLATSGVEMDAFGRSLLLGLVYFRHVRVRLSNVQLFQEYLAAIASTSGTQTPREKNKPLPLVS